MIKIPKVSDEIQKRYGGKTAGAVNGRLVVFGKTSLEVAEKAEAKGYDPEEVLILTIPRVGALYV
jgi:hypothetical protein